MSQVYYLYTTIVNQRLAEQVPHARLPQEHNAETRRAEKLADDCQRLGYYEGEHGKALRLLKCSPSSHPRGGNYPWCERARSSHVGQVLGLAEQRCEARIDALGHFANHGCHRASRGHGMQQFICPGFQLSRQRRRSVST